MYSYLSLPFQLALANPGWLLPLLSGLLQEATELQDLALGQCQLRFQQWQSGSQIDGTHSQRGALCYNPEMFKQAANIMAMIFMVSKLISNEQIKIWKLKN